MELYAKNFDGSDNEKIERAIAAHTVGDIVVIEGKDNNQPWILDRAILIPANTTVVLRNCKLKLSDRCRDNFIRSANCGFGFAYPERIENIHIKGEGFCVLEGADHPRATGDASKVLANPCPYLDEDLCSLAYWVDEENKKLGKPSFEEKHNHSYGTDAGKEGESQYGDWRGIGILLANVQNFSIENIKIVKSHGWNISLEDCAFGRVEKICFESCMTAKIDGMFQNLENQDGIDIRNGCHHITISDISGETGDDVIALTAIRRDNSFLPGGSLRSTHVMHNDWSIRESGIRDIIIRNVIAKSNLCAVVRLLPVGTQIQNVIIDGVIDTNPEGHSTWTTIILGENDGGYGENLKDSLKNIVISNVICNSNDAITVGGYLSDSVISNVTCNAKAGKVLKVERENGLRNVSVNNLIVSS